MNLTIDVGTTNTKISLWKNDKQLLWQEKFATPKLFLGKFVNFDVDLLMEKLFKTIQYLDSDKKNQVRKISITSVGESGVLLDNAGERASSMIAWYDNRSQPFIDKLTRNERRKIYEITGLPAHAHYSASKIRWLFDNEVDPTKQYNWLCIPDYIAYILTGVMATENTLASRTLLFDIHQKNWSNELKSIFNIPNVSLPSVVSSGEIIGHLKEKKSKELGLSSAVSVTIAGHDHMVGSVASDQKEGEILDSTGTTEGILLLTKELNINKEKEEAGIAHGVYVNSEFYTVFTSLPSAGSIIQWFTNIFQLSSEDFETLMNDAYEDYMSDQFEYEKITWLIPHFDGSGTPVKSTRTRGLWYGLNVNTELEELIFGMFVGLTFELKHALSFLTNKRISKIKLIGPATKDPLWIQLRADLLNVPVEIVETSEAVSQGANIIGNLENEYSVGEQTTKKIRYFPNEKSKIREKLLTIYQNEYRPIYDKKITFETRKKS